MGIIVVVPGVLAAWMALTKSPLQAFLYVYLPTLFFLPDYYRWIAPGMPDPSFHHTAALAILFAWMSKGGSARWQTSLTDVIVYAYVAVVAYSEYAAAGYSEAQNLMFDAFAGTLVPYILAKGLLRTPEAILRFVKMFCWVIFLVAVTAIYEFRFGRCPYVIFLGPFFPGQGGWVTTLRWGFARTAGPYGHAIICGAILLTAFRLQRWLQKEGFWENAKKAKRITWGIVLGSAMTMCRGPWIGGVVGSIPTFIGFAKNRKKVTIIALTLLIGIGTPAWVAFQAYTAVGRAGATSDTQETAAYRKELMDKYTEIALEKSAFGWGRNTWPKIPGMPSIDNHYLLLALMHGCIALLLFWLIFLWLALRLGIRGANLPRSSPHGTLCFSLLSFYIAMFITIATVFLGGQSNQMFFLITGLAEAVVLLRGMDFRGDAPTLATERSHGLRFRRVLT
ncbi:MAG: O-antigen ligase domain-containing protein [Planctomycetes bacterium]|nr:O-antigen ligase domain-containing protein [Planctomycetota bacterium]